MTDPLTPFERSLRDRAPREASPRLQAQLAAALDAPERPAWRLIGSLLATAAAIAILATVLWPSPSPLVPPPVAVQPQPTPAPSALAYRRALADSDQAFDRLLDEHARVLLRGNGQVRALNLNQSLPDPEL